MPILPHLAAAALTAPVIILTPADYPQDALSQDQSAAALVAISLDSTGRATACETRQTAGHERLARRICGLLLKRRHTPSKLRDGTPVNAEIVTLMRLFIPDTFEGSRVAKLTQKPDVELSVNHLPGNAKSADVRIALAINEAGSVSDCGADYREKQAALVAVACSDPARFGTYPLRNAGGPAQPYVTQLKVRFMAEAPQP